MSGRLQSGTPHLAALIRAKLTREGSPAAASSASRRVSDAAARRSEGGRCCWLCSNEIRTSNRGESVYLVDNACGATGEGCPCLCAGCFLVAYLTLRDSFPSSQERLVTHRKLEAKFDASVDQILSGTSSAVANAVAAVAAEAGLGLSQTATATQRETLFVNSYSLRSFVAVDADAASEASSPPPTTPSMVPFSKSSRAVPTPPSVLGAVGDWQCPQCTLINTAASGNVVRCFACNATNPEAYPCHCCSTLLHPRLFQLGKAPLRCAVRVSPPAPPPHPPTTHISPTTTPRSMHSNTSPPHPPTTRPASKRTSAPPLLFDNSTVASTQVVDSFVKRNSVLSPLGRSISNALDFIKSDSQPATTTANSVSTKTVTSEALRHQLWVCDSCTLVNVRATRCCEMCGGPRQVACGKCTLLNSVPAIAYQTHAAPSVSCEICTKPIAIPDVDARLAAFAFDSKQQQPLDVSMTSSMMREARRSDDIVKGERRLRHRVEKQLHAFMRVQVGDGSCLFRAISDELFGQPLLHQVVRHLICSYMASPEARGAYSLYFESDSVYDGYLQRLAQEGTWGDELCIHAASQLFHATITVISSMETYWSQTFQAPVEDNDDDEARASSTNNKQPIRIFLAYTNPVHFDSIRLERSAPPSSSAAAAPGDETSSVTMMGQLLHSLTESLLEERQWTDAGHDHAMIASKANTYNEWHMVHTEDHQ